MVYFLLKIPMIPAIKNQLNLMYTPQRSTKQTKRTYKIKRSSIKNAKDKAAAAEIFNKQERI